MRSEDPPDHCFMISHKVLNDILISQNSNYGMADPGQGTGVAQAPNLCVSQIDLIEIFYWSLKQNLTCLIAWTNGNRFLQKGLRPKSKGKFCGHLSVPRLLCGIQ